MQGLALSPIKKRERRAPAVLPVKVKVELDIGFRMEIRWIGDDVEFENDEEDDAGARVCGSVRETEEVKQWNSFGKSGNQKTVGCSIQKRKRKRKKRITCRN